MIQEKPMLLNTPQFFELKIEFALWQEKPEKGPLMLFTTYTVQRALRLIIMACFNFLDYNLSFSVTADTSQTLTLCTSYW